jgi:hypothetical protein
MSEPTASHHMPPPPLERRRAGTVPLPHRRPATPVRTRHLDHARQVHLSSSVPMVKTTWWLSCCGTTGRRATMPDRSAEMTGAAREPCAVAWADRAVMAVGSGRASAMWPRAGFGPQLFTGFQFSEILSN